LGRQHALNKELQPT